MFDLRRLARFSPKERRTPALGPRVAIWGLFDLSDYGDLLVPRIFEYELRRRLPLARVYTYAPLGYRHPIAMDGGRPAVPLDADEPARKDHLAEEHDLVVVTGEVIHTRDDLYAGRYRIPVEEAQRLRPSGFFVDGLGPELERRRQVSWHAVGVPFDLNPAEAQRVKTALDSKDHVSVRDSASRERLLATGSTRDIAVVPDLTVLVARLFDAEVLRKRLAYLRVMDWYPASGSPVIVQGDTTVVERASEIAQAVQALSVPIVLAELSSWRGDKRFADAIEPLLPRPVFRLPTEVSLEDLAAAIAHAGAFIGTSPQGSSTALAFCVPLVKLTDAPVLEPTVDETMRAELQGQADSEMDALSAIAERLWSDRAGADKRIPSELARALSQAEERYEALLRAHEARGERLVTERLQFAEIVDRLEEAGGGLTAEAALRIAELENAVFTAQAAEAEARFELEQPRTGRARRG